MGTAQSKDLQTEYDLVLDVQSLQAVARSEDGKSGGWPIYLSAKKLKIVEELYNKLTAEDRPAQYILERLCEKLNLTGNAYVSAVGLFDRGKTFLLNKLAGTGLPSGHRVNTKGVSFFQPLTQIARNLLLLDTAGTNAPVVGAAGPAPTNGDEVDKMLAQQQSTENFLQDLVFLLSDIIIVVVNELTWMDQQVIFALQNKLMNADKDFKTLLVVHNYMNISEETELLYMWRKCVLSSYGGGQLINSEVTLPNGKQALTPYFVCGNTHHFMLAKDDSPAGKKWNPRTITFLQSFINTRVHTTQQKDSLAKHVLKNVTKLLHDYCKNVASVDISYNPHPQPDAAAEDQPAVAGADLLAPSEPTTDITYYVTDADGDVLDSEWIRPIVVELPNSDGHFCISAVGDLTLLKEKIIYDGYRMVPVSSNQYQPSIDVLQNDDGILVTVDYPGHEAGGIDPEDGGTISAVVDVERRELVISGKRYLVAYPPIKTSNGTWTFRDYPIVYGEAVTSESPERIKEDLIKMRPTLQERRSGDFSRPVPIPDGYDASGNIGKFAIVNGVAQIFIPKLAPVVAKQPDTFVPKRRDARK